MILAPLTALPAAIAPLQQAASAEGFRFIDRLANDWQAGTNRFAAQGETLLAAWQGETMLAIGGLNRDPYRPEPGIARLRHLYVLPAARRTGVASALVSALLTHAAAHFHRVRLRATPQAVPLYLRLGFTPVEDETATHQIERSAAIHAFSRRRSG